MSDKMNKEWIDWVLKRIIENEGKIRNSLKENKPVPNKAIRWCVRMLLEIQEDWEQGDGKSPAPDDASACDPNKEDYWKWVLRESPRSALYLFKNVMPGWHIWLTPWTPLVSKDGRVWVDGKHRVSQMHLESGGTINTRLIMNEDGESVTLIFQTEQQIIEYLYRDTYRGTDGEMGDHLPVTILRAADRPCVDNYLEKKKLCV